MNIKIKPEDILTKVTLIGDSVEVIEASNKLLVGIKGTVIDESKEMLILKVNKGIKKLLKSQVTLKVKSKELGKTYIVDGKLLRGRIEKRIKK